MINRKWRWSALLSFTSFSQLYNCNKAATTWPKTESQQATRAWGSRFLTTSGIKESAILRARFFLQSSLSFRPAGHSFFFCYLCLLVKKGFIAPPVVELQVRTLLLTQWAQLSDPQFLTQNLSTGSSLKQEVRFW